MASRKDSDRRKARDAQLRTQDEMIARHLEEARRSGELLREIAECASEAERKALGQRLAELELAIALRLEGLRATGKL